MKGLIIAALLFSAPGVFGQNYLAAPAATQPPFITSVSIPVSSDTRRIPLRVWKWSLAPLVTSHPLDAGSSWGHVERNSLLASPNGRFEAKAAEIKLGSVGLAIAAEYFLLKRHPKLAKFIIRANYANSALTSGFAVHNFVTVH
jgi:hypothetical protein